MTDRPPPSHRSPARRAVLLPALVTAIVLTAGSPARAAGGRESHSPFTYLGTTLANVVYIPAKIVYAGIGAVASGLTYTATFGNSAATNAVWNSAVEGTYILTPRMIEGKEPVRFSGP